MPAIQGQSCLFCRILARMQSGDPLGWFNVELWRNDDFVIIPALGPLCPGHVLLVSRACVGSMALCARQGLAPDKALMEFTQAHHKFYDRSFVFEHGAGHGPSSSCIEHAHWHILPGQFLLPAWRAQADPSSSFDDFRQTDAAHQNYLMTRDDEGVILAKAQRQAPCQYFRRMIAAELGAPETWDYFVHPKLDVIRETLAMFSSLPGFSACHQP